MGRSTLRQSTPSPVPFLVLDENRFAHAAIERIVEEPPSSLGRIILLYGPTGAGKSHLTDLLSRELRQRAKLVATQCAASELLEGTPPHWNDCQNSNGARQILICEDIQSLVRHTAAQNELVKSIDECRRHGTDVVLTANRSPGSLTGLLPRLRSRLRSGVCAAVRLPEPASRERLLRHFCCHLQIPVTASAIQLFVRDMPVSPRELLGAIQRFEEVARLKKQPLDVAFARDFLKAEVQPSEITVDEIAKAVTKEFGVRLGEMRSESRDQLLRTARQCAMFLCRELTDSKFAAIGEYFGNRSHSTVMHACNRVQASLPTDARLRQRIDSVKQSLGAN